MQIVNMQKRHFGVRGNVGFDFGSLSLCGVRYLQCQIFFQTYYLVATFLFTMKFLHWKLIELTEIKLLPTSEKYCIFPKTDIFRHNMRNLFEIAAHYILNNYKISILCLVTLIKIKRGSFLMKKCIFLTLCKNAIFGVGVI